MHGVCTLDEWCTGRWAEDHQEEILAAVFEHVVQLLERLEVKVGAASDLAHLSADGADIGGAVQVVAAVEAVVQGQVKTVDQVVRAIGSARVAKVGEGILAVQPIECGRRRGAAGQGLHRLPEDVELCRDSLARSDRQAQLVHHASRVEARVPVVIHTLQAEGVRLRVAAREAVTVHRGGGCDRRQGLRAIIARRGPRARDVLHEVDITATCITAHEHRASVSVAEGNATCAGGCPSVVDRALTCTQAH